MPESWQRLHSRVSVNLACSLRLDAIPQSGSSGQFGQLLNQEKSLQRARPNNPAARHVTQQLRIRRSLSPGQQLLLSQRSWQGNPYSGPIAFSAPPRSGAEVGRHEPSAWLFNWFVLCRMLNSSPFHALMCMLLTNCTHDGVGLHAYQYRYRS